MAYNLLWIFGDNFLSGPIISIIFSIIFGIGLVLPKDNVIEKRKLRIVGLVSICVILLYFFSSADFKILYNSLLFCLGFLFTVRSIISKRLEDAVRNAAMATYSGLIMCVLAYFLYGQKAGQSPEASMFAGFIVISAGIIGLLISLRKPKSSDNGI